MKRNSLIKRIAVGIMAFSLIIPAVPASAQMQYDPTEDGNHGIYIDTTQVESMDIKNNDIVVKVPGGQVGSEIDVKRNVSFSLDANVDVTWNITSNPTDANVGIDDVYKSVTGVTLNSVSGEVQIARNATVGTYKITASPINVDSVKKPDIEIVVNKSIAEPTKIILDKEAIEASYPGLITVAETLSDEEVTAQTLICDGYVEGAQLDTIIEPSYILYNQRNVQHFNANNDNNENYSYYGMNRFTTNKPYTDKNVGKSELRIDGNKYGEYSVSINKTDHVLDLNAQFETTIKNEKKRAFTFEKNHIDTLTVSENSDVAFNANGNRKFIVSEDYVDSPDQNEEGDLNYNRDYQSQSINWELSVGNDPLEPNDEGVYTVYGTKESLQNGQKVIDYPEVAFISFNDSRTIKVITTNISADTVPAITLKATYLLSGERDKVSTNTFTLNFTQNESTISDIGLDFEKFGLVKDVDFTVVDETINGVTTPVYYFETGLGLNLPELTFANKDGVLSFENSKNKNFADDNDAFTIQYRFFDTNEKEITKYKNADLVGNNQLIANPSDVVLDGIGYKRIQLQITKAEGASVSAAKEKINYYIRTVSSSDSLDPNVQINGLVINHGSGSYNIGQGEVVHVRKGEAVVPSILGGEAPDLSNPYMDYSFKPDTGIVNKYRDEGDGQYRLSGVKAGRVLVTAQGTVNKNNTRTFWMYVNKDNNDNISVEISFDDAIKEEMVTRNGNSDDDYIVEGAWSRIPVRLVLGNNASPTTGIPEVEWHINAGNDEYATIKDENGIGILTTYKSTNTSEPLTISATDESGNEYATATFSIRKVGITSISKFAEKTVVGNDSVVKNPTDTSGTIEVGDSFTLIPAEYEPANATDVQNSISWKVSPADVASVDENGLVTGLKAGEAVITSVITVNGLSKDSLKYSLTVKEADVVVEQIVAPDSLDIRGLGPDASQKINASVLPANAKNQALSFQVEDSTIASVDGSTGTVTGLKVGKTTVTISSSNGKTKTVVINVLGVDDNPTVDPDTKVDETKVSDAVAKINAIGTVTADDASKAKIDAAKAAYDALTTAEKAKVDPVVVAKLTVAQKTYDTVKGEEDKKKETDKAASDPVVAAINALPATITTTDEAGITAARTAYDKLTEDQKKLVSADVLKKLTDAEAALAQEKAKEAAAKNISATKISFAKNNKSKKILVKVKSVSGASGYQVRYSLKKSMKKSKTKDITKTSVTLSKLKKGKTYYIQARAVATYNGTKYYSKWTAKKKVKVKK